MLRSLIAYVSFLIAIAFALLPNMGTAHAEMPFEAWLSVATVSVDQQIDSQMERSRQSFELAAQSVAERFDQVIQQCRLGMGGARGSQLVCAVELLEQLRESGVAGVLAPAKNWGFPAEYYVQKRQTVVSSEQKRHPQGQTKITVLEQANRGLRQRVANDETVVKIGESVYRRAEPLVLAASRGWDRLMKLAAASHRSAVANHSFVVQPAVEVQPATQLQPATQPQPAVENLAMDSKFESKLDSYWEYYSACDRWEVTLQSIRTTGSAAAPQRSEVDMLKRCWRALSNSAQAKLNWLTSKVRHLADACLKSIEPQYLILEFECVENLDHSDGPQSQTPSHPSVAEVPHSNH